MKKAFLFMTAAFLAVVPASMQAQTNRSEGSDAAVRQMAKEGDMVQVIINAVKADKREQFEKFIHEIFWSQAQKLSSNEQRVFRQTRVLHPVRPEQDGTYSYVFIMDPLITGGDYNIQNLLQKMYGADKAAEYMKMSREALARDQTQIMLVQARYY